MHLSQEQIQQARQANLYDFVMLNHADLFKPDGREWIKFKNDNSIGIKRNSPFYVDFAHHAPSGDRNAIAFLVNELNYSFEQAVTALTGTPQKPFNVPKPIEHSPDEKKRPALTTPPKKANSEKRILAYLIKTRGLSYETVKDLIKRGILFQEEKFGNCIFMNPNKKFAEIRGTAKGKKFHGIYKSEACKLPIWYYFPQIDSHGHAPEPPEKVYICESAIDAISLFEIQKDNNSMYVSIAGSKKYTPIKTMLTNQTYKSRLIIATDADESGDETRQHFSELPNIRPTAGKDWNEVLLKERQGR